MNEDSRGRAPSVSIIVPVHAAAATVAESIGSLLRQTHRELEVVAVADGASTATLAALDELATTDERLRVLRQERAGVAAARNRGIEAARGRYLTFLDADDRAEPHAIATLLRAAVETDADVVVAGFCREQWDACGEVVTAQVRVPPPLLLGGGGDRFPRPTPDLVNLIGYAWNKLYRAEVLRGSGGFDPEFVVQEDLWLNARLLADAERVAFVDRSVVRFAQRPGPSLSSMRTDEFLALRLAALERLAELLLVWQCDPGDVARVIGTLTAGSVAFDASSAERDRDLRGGARARHLQRGREELRRHPDVARPRRAWRVRDVIIVLGYRHVPAPLILAAARVARGRRRLSGLSGPSERTGRPRTLGA